jgi:hypothetical protein
MAAAGLIRMPASPFSLIKAHFGGNAFHDIFGGHRPLGWGVVGHGNWCGSERRPCQNACFWGLDQASSEAMGEAEGNHALGYFWQGIRTGQRVCAGDTLASHPGCGGVILWACATRPKPSKSSICY